MNSRATVPVLMICGALAVSGCEGNSMPWLTGQHGPFGTENLIDRESFQKIDLAAVMTGGDISLEGTTNQKREFLEAALSEFPNDRSRRNQVQERILAASNQACAEYKRDLKRLDARSNLILGFLTTATAGAGAIFTGTDTVRALAGTAAILSGARSEFNENYFQALTVQLIVEGIENKRQEIYEEILVARRDTEFADEYPVQRAIKDAIAYHDNCSLIAGLQHAALSLERAKNPGLKQLNRSLDDIRTAREKVDRIAGVEAKGLAPTLDLDPKDTDATGNDFNFGYGKRISRGSYNGYGRQAQGG